MRPPKHDRSAYLRDCGQLNLMRRRAEESPFMTKAERERASEMLRLVMELFDRTSKKAVSSNGAKAAKSGGKSVAA